MASTSTPTDAALLAPLPVAEPIAPIAPNAASLLIDTPLTLTLPGVAGPAVLTASTLTSTPAAAAAALTSAASAAASAASAASLAASFSASDSASDSPSPPPRSSASAA